MFTFISLLLSYFLLDGGVFFCGVYVLFIYVIIKIIRTKFIHISKKFIFVGIVIIIIYFFSLELVIFFYLTEPLCLMDGYLKILDTLEIELEKAKKALDCLEKIYDAKYPDNLPLS